MLGGPLKKLFAEFDSIKNSGCHGNQMEFVKEFFKSLLLKLLVWFWNNFTGLFLVWPLSKSVCEILICRKTWPPNGEAFFTVDLGEILQNSSLLKLLVRFWNNFTGFFLGWPFSKIVHEILICRNTWLPWGGGFFHCVDLREILLWNRLSDFEIISQDCSFGDPFQKLYAKFWSDKNMAAMGGWGGCLDFLRYSDMKKFLKNLLLWNPWSDFEIISQECSLGNPFQKLFMKVWSVNPFPNNKF